MRERAVQSMLLKKGCSFSSAAPRCAPRRCLGLRLRSCQREIELTWEFEARKKITTHPLDKLLPLVTNHTLWEPNLAITYVLVHLLRIFCIKWAPTTTHLKEQYSETPKINNLGIAVLVEEDFWSEVLGGATKGGGEFVGAQIGFGETKVAESDMACCVEEDVFGFEVTRDEVKQPFRAERQRKRTDRRCYTCANAPRPISVLRYKTWLSPLQTSSLAASARTTRHHS